MAQVKKEGVRDAILSAAFSLFKEKGYNNTSVPLIARTAGTSTANVYVYFPSKLEILFALYTPWLQTQLDQLECSLRRLRSPQARLEKILLTLWRDIPFGDNGFSSNLVQALSGSPSDGYKPVLRNDFRARIIRWLTELLALSRREAEQIATVLLMAFDGFVINTSLPEGAVFDAKSARLICQLLMSTGKD